MQVSNTIYKDIVLIGGGHTHALVIKMWGMKPLPGVRLTLISNAVTTPYSGMLPGLVSGHYSFEQTHIDLLKLCAWANVRFICANVTGFNPLEKNISLAQRPKIEYDIVSINTGSTPTINQTQGAKEHATAVKPIAQFYQKWQQLQSAIKSADKPLDIALVGAGAGGFELICAMHHASQNSHQQLIQHRFHWVVSGDSILKGHNSKVQALARRHCEQMQIQIHYNFAVERVSKQQLQAKTHSNDLQPPKTLKVDEVIWCTAASPATWPAKAKLALDKQGFIAIDDHLRSTSHPDVFAVGDAATQIRAPRPKAGVFAVRQAPILFANLRHTVLKQPLKTHRPQRNFLSLLAIGDKQAIASKGRWSFAGKRIWQLKNYIDQSFMDKLCVLPQKPAMQQTACDTVLLETQSEDQAKMRCGGCGAKVASSVLSDTLKKVTRDITPHQRDDIIIGLESPDDAAISSTSGKLLAQSVDQFRSIIDDPYIFAKIATNHALSDLHAMACDPQSALSIVAMPFAGTNIQKRELYQLSYGIIEELNAARCTLTGGHTSEASELSLGLCVNGLIDEQSIKTKTGVSAGQQLILTKAFGTGVIMAAHMQAMVRGEEVQLCLENMMLSNQNAASILKQHGSTAMTDLTGFGLIGHLLEMLAGTELICEIKLSALPLLKGAIALSRSGIQSSLYPKNHEASQTISDLSQWQTHSCYPLLFDPQTSGGLLAWVDAKDADSCVQQLNNAGFADACIIAQAMQNPNDDSRHNIRLIE